MFGVIAAWSATAVTAVAVLESFADVAKEADVSEWALSDVDSDAFVELADIECVCVPNVELFAPFPIIKASPKLGKLKVLLPFPVPYAVEEIAKKGDEKFFELPKPLSKNKNLNFSKLPDFPP